MLTFCLATPLNAQQSVADTDGLGRKLDGRALKTFLLTSTDQGYYIPSASNGIFSEDADGNKDTAIIAGKHAIVSWSILPDQTGNHELLAALYDDDSSGVPKTILLNEHEVTATVQVPMTFAHARGLMHGLVIRNGGGTHILIQYVDIR